MRLAALIALTMLLPGAVSDECIGQTSPEVNVVGFYVDNSFCQPGCLMSTVVYEESNGLSGLQRRDSHADDTCGGAIAPDTLLVELA